MVSLAIVGPMRFVIINATASFTIYSNDVDVKLLTMLEDVIIMIVFMVYFIVSVQRLIYFSILKLNNWLDCMT